MTNRRTLSSRLVASLAVACLSLSTLHADESSGTVPAPWQATTTVGQVVAERPATARIFELLGIDYCCGGKSTLQAAAQAKGVDAQALLAALLVVGPPTGDNAASTDWTKATLPTLMDHIVTTHHAYLRRELPRLSGILATVTRVHGEAHPELAEIQRTYAVLASELPPHLDEEEQRVFPAIREAAQAESPDAKTRAALRKMLAGLDEDHDAAGAALHRLRTLTKEYTLPKDACRLYTALYNGLKALERDLHMHVHLENNVLHPRARALVTE